ncbi:MAG: ABC transporter permease [Anaerolineae bacterium]|nr:ABC transporter permease [Anaerolineae bacterium]
MIKTRTRKLLRDITARKTRTLLVSLSIFIGVLGVVTLYSLGDITTRTLEAAIDTERLAMVRTYQLLDDADATLDHAAYLEQLQQLPEVEAVQFLGIRAAYWQAAGEERFSEARVFSYAQPFDALPLEPVSLIEGRYPVAGQREIAVERRFANAHGVGLGDTLTLRMLGGEVEAGAVARTAEWTIVGTVFSPINIRWCQGRRRPSWGRTCSLRRRRMSS